MAAREKGKAEQFASDFDIPKVKIGKMESKNKLCWNFRSIYGG